MALENADISLIGYDNVRNARYFSPALTTIHQPKTRWASVFNMLLTARQ